jgi:hypothetical protein
MTSLGPSKPYQLSRVIQVPLEFQSARRFDTLATESDTGPHKEASQCDLPNPRHERPTLQKHLQDNVLKPQNPKTLKPE